MKCNLCGGTEFGPMRQRPTERCLACDSLARTRLLWLFIDRLDLGDAPRVLHFAPERSLYGALKRKFPAADYVAADIDPAVYPFCEITVVDLCRMEEIPSNSFDLIIHSHVLEHTPCTIGYSLFHLHRILTPTGRHVCILPFTPGRYDETFQDIPVDERIRRFGQSDHVRKFGADDVGAHVGKLLNIPEKYDLLAEFTAEELTEANISSVNWQRFTINSVLDLGKGDMLAMS